MPFDFDIKSICNHLIDGVQYWGEDQINTELRLKLNSNPNFRRIFFQKMNARICPRCNGRGWYWDIHFEKNIKTPDALSYPVLIRGRAKLKQEVRKYLTTVIGDNKLYPQYGIGYQDFIGKKITDTTRTMLEVTTLSGLNYLRTLYIQYVPPSEQFSVIDNMEVIYDQNSLTAFFINATLVSMDEERSRISYEVDLIPTAAVEPYTSRVSSFEILD